MSDSTPKRSEFLTEGEKALQRAITAKRYEPYRNVTVSPKDATQLGYLFDAAMRGGTVYSEYAQFRADQQVEWALRTLSMLCEQRVEYDRRKVAFFGWDDGWDKAKAEIERLFNEKFEADRAEQQDEFDAFVEDNAQAEWRDHYPSTVVEGDVVVDPWGFPEALWFLRNMTQFTVFTIWQTVNDAVQECLLESLGDFAEGQTRNVSDPRKVAEEAFEKAIRNLDEFIAKAMKEEAEQAAAEAARNAPITCVADLLDDARA